MLNYNPDFNLIGPEPPRKPKYIPKLFATPMVRALDMGIKTHTRRIDDGKSNIHPGDIIWVRETTAIVGNTVVYKAKLSDDAIQTLSKTGVKWKPSLFMKMVDCRIFLEVESVDREHIQSITTEDADNEGVMIFDIYDQNFAKKTFVSDPLVTFRKLWESINGKTGPKSWDENPVVKVIKFKRIYPNEKTTQRNN